MGYFDLVVLKIVVIRCTCLKIGCKLKMIVDQKGNEICDSVTIVIHRWGTLDLAVVCLESFRAFVSKLVP